MELLPVLQFPYAMGPSWLIIMGFACSCVDGKSFARRIALAHKSTADSPISPHEFISYPFYSAVWTYAPSNPRKSWILRSARHGVLKYIHCTNVLPFWSYELVRYIILHEWARKTSSGVYMVEVNINHKTNYDWNEIQREIKYQHDPSVVIVERSWLGREKQRRVAPSPIPLHPPPPDI